MKMNRFYGGIMSIMLSAILLSGSFVTKVSAVYTDCSHPFEQITVGERTKTEQHLVPLFWVNGEHAGMAGCDITRVYRTERRHCPTCGRVTGDTIVGLISESHSLSHP